MLSVPDPFVNVFERLAALMTVSTFAPRVSALVSVGEVSEVSDPVLRLNCLPHKGQRFEIAKGRERYWKITDFTDLTDHGRGCARQ